MSEREGLTGEGRSAYLGGKEVEVGDRKGVHEVAIDCHSYLNGAGSEGQYVGEEEYCGWSKRVRGGVGQ